MSDVTCILSQIYAGDVSISTADTDWAYAKCWLQLELAGTTNSQPTD